MVVDEDIEPVEQTGLLGIEHVGRRPVNWLRTVR
jgi:hypothetical protein